jgi:hypothetical protein
VNAFHVIIYDVVLLAGVSNRRPASFAMAFCAEIGNVGRIRRRIHAAVIFDSVFAMAVEAHGCVGVAPAGQRAVSAGVICRNDLSVADGAIDFGRDAGAGPVVLRAGASVTLGTSGVTMNGASDLSSINIKRKGIAITNCEQAGPGMAPEAIPVRHPQLVENLAHAMRGMAVNTNGDFVGFFFPQFAADYLAMNLLYQTMAFFACPGNIVTIDS